MLSALYYLLRQLLMTGFIFHCAFEASLAKDFDDSEIKHIDYPDWFQETPFLDLADELKDARVNGKKGLMNVILK